MSTKFRRSNYWFRKYPLLRCFVVLGLVALLFYTITYIISMGDAEPQILDIHPTVGEAGDIMTISGANFGTRNSSSSVTIGEVRQTSSSFLEWSDTNISFVLPYNVADGLVYVETRHGCSLPSVFVNKETIPVPVVHNTRVAHPLIESITVSDNTIGGIVTIEGSNFGTIRDTSQVFFTTQSSSSTSSSDVIACSEFNKDYTFWSDNRIQVRIPEGAVTGDVFVKTVRGLSEGYKLTVFTGLGTKTYGTQRTYVVDVNADIKGIQAEEHATISLFMPFPKTTVTQRNVEVLLSEPKPESEYSNTFVQQISQNSLQDKITFKHSFSLDVYDVFTKVNANQVRKYSNEVLTYYNDYLKSDSIIESDTDEIIALAEEIVGRENNVWRKARLIYDWMLENIEIVDELRNLDADVLDVLTTKSADAYEMAILYTSLLRAVGIIAIPNAGILVDADLYSQNHWWTEFYLEGLGWVPVDVALGAGLQYNYFQVPDDVENFYFGNLDAQHIVFSRGVNNIGQTLLDGKRVYRPKTYALQTIWEESTEGVLKYSSYWQNAMVIGVY